MELYRLLRLSELFYELSEIGKEAITEKKKSQARVKIVLQLLWIIPWALTIISELDVVLVKPYDLSEWMESAIAVRTQWYMAYLKVIWDIARTSC